MKKNHNENEEIIIEDDGASWNDKLKKLRQKLDLVEKEKTEYLSGWQRERADFANFKKDANKNIINSIELAKIDILSQFLGVLDSFDLALESPQWSDLPPDWQKGMKSIHSQLVSVFKEYGVIEIKNEGDFDPLLHEAVRTIETKDQKEDGKIANIVNKGYKINDKILRVAKVEVFKYKGN